MVDIEKRNIDDLTKLFVGNPVIYEIIMKTAEKAKDSRKILGCLIGVIFALEHQKVLPALISPESYEEAINNNNGNLLSLYEVEMEKLKNREDTIADIAIKMLIDMFYPEEGGDKRLAIETIAIILNASIEAERKDKTKTPD